MISVKANIWRIQVLGVSTSLVMGFASIGAPLERLSTHRSRASSTEYSTKRLADGKEWTTQNLDLNTVPSYCYENVDLNCRKYGRLYTWESAQRVCQSLGDGWRLPTDDQWRQMAKHYGGVSQDADDKGKAAYKALLAGGSSGFNARLGGGRSDQGQYARKEAHGFYWTASENDLATGWFYNFAGGGQALHRQSGGDKQWAFSVRCVRD